MLTRLVVDGFKNLVGVDLRLGPFTCIAGANGVGKSNLFDAIRFLGAIADQPLMEAALAVRSEGGRGADIGGLFHRVGDDAAGTMRFEAEMLVAPQAVDDLGQPAEATTTFLRYVLELRLRSTDASTGGLEVVREELTHITQGDARDRLGFDLKAAWLKSAVRGKRGSPFISTESVDGKTYIKRHQDSKQGRPQTFLATALPRTVLSSANAAESQTALVARREMSSWRLLQLEPSALRAPDDFTAPNRIAANGAHVAGTLARLAHINRRDGGNGAGAAVLARVANRLSDLVGNIRSVGIDRDDKRERYTVVVTELDGTRHEARALSDGTLRFLALAALESDPEARGVLCFEEPENGIHPDRVAKMLDVLRDLSVDVEAEVGDENPLRQVIVNTHSPGVVAQVPDGSLVMAVLVPSAREGRRFHRVAFRCLPGTWRTRTSPDARTMVRGELLAYLAPLVRERQEVRPDSRRVIDRPDVQQMTIPGLGRPS